MSDRIIIVGAGICGLYLGNILAEHGYNVTILEARQRIGGRIWSLKEPFSVSVEAGAEFVHGEQPITRSLLKKAGAKMKPLKGHWKQIVEGQLQETNLFEEHWEEMLSRLRELKLDTDIASFLDSNFSGPRYDDFKKSVKGFVEGYDAADSARVSSFALLEEWDKHDDDSQYHIEGGYGTVIDYLEVSLKQHGGAIHLDVDVSQVNWSGSGVTMSSRTGRSFEAEKAIVTVPLGVLQKGAVKFIPELPFGMDLFSRMGNGGVIKFLFEFKSFFWENRREGVFKNLAFLTSDANVPTWWTQSHKDVPILTGWLGGPDTFQHSDQMTLYERAVDSLAYLFDYKREEIVGHIKAWYIADWIAEPFTAGAYAYATTDTKDALKVLFQPIANTLFFAGEAIYEGPAMGTVEAAFSSAERVAALILKSDRPPKQE